MTDPMSLDDPFLPLAFSLHSTPGAYAVLAGAGVSRGAGLPTAWDIVVDLVNQIRRLEVPTAIDLTTADAGTWYEEKFGHEPEYSELLEQLAPTPHAREALLRGYFERRDEDDDELPGPSRAHTAVADLMAIGVIKVVVTLNFDRLFEKALRNRQIEPLVIATDADAAGMPPLHTIDHCVIHLHGDYRSAASMLNTSAELSAYKPAMQHLLEDVARNYGLIVAGWSVTYDHALKEAIARDHLPRYTMGWIDPGDLNAAATELSNAKSAVHLQSTADNAFGRLSDQVITLRERQARHPLTVAVAASRIKRQLAGQSPAINAHDMVSTELGQLVEHPALQLRNYHDGDGHGYGERSLQLAEASRTAAACVATLAYWGDETTDEWWLTEIERFARTPRVGGTASFIELPFIVGSRLFYAAGIAATAARRYSLVNRLLRLHTVRIGRMYPEPLSSVLDWSNVHQYLPNDSVVRTPEAISDIIGEVLTLNTARTDEARQTFEILRIISQILAGETFMDHMTEYASHDHALNAARQLGSPDAVSKWHAERDRVLEQMASVCRISPPHVWVIDTHTREGNRWLSPSADRLSADVPDLLVFAKHLPDVKADDAIQAALAAAANYVARCARDVRHGHFPADGAGWIPSEFWLDGTS